MQETPYSKSVTHSPEGETDLPFAGDDAAPLEGEERCICGELEGAHQVVTGFCPLTGCLHFVAEDFDEEPTAPDLVVEYDAGVEPLAGGR